MINFYSPDLNYSVNDSPRSSTDSVVPTHTSKAPLPNHTPAASGYSKSVHTNEKKTQESLEKKTQVRFEKKTPAVYTRQNSTPSKKTRILRLLSRASSFALIFCAIGHFGFALGASPYSGQPVPFKSSMWLYFLCAVAVMSFIFSLLRAFMIKALSNKKIVMIVVDALFVVMWGLGIFFELFKFTCPPGQHNGWCHFYNVSIFFGILSFVFCIILFISDVFTKFSK